MGRKALRTTFNMDGAFNDVALSLMPGANATEVIFRLDRLLDTYGALGAYDRTDLAVAMLVAGSYATDARKYLINTQFRTVQRDDVTIVFNEPRPARSRYEVAHLPGVLYAEPFRSVAVRLRFEHRSRCLPLPPFRLDFCWDTALQLCCR